MKVPYFIPWITDKDKKAVMNSLNQRWFTNGPNLELFEKLGAAPAEKNFGRWYAHMAGLKAKGGLP